MASDCEVPHITPSSGDLGDRSCGPGVSEVLDVIRTLESRGIPNCVTGAGALAYYGAGRVTQDWEIAVPDELFHTAKTLFSENPGYELSKPVMPQPRSLIHTYPLFKLKGAGFTFLLVPASEARVSCDPAECERSHHGIPYPKLEHFAQSLLDTQKYADLEDLVDGMDLDKAWGEANLQFDHVPIDYINRKNALICQSLPGLPGLMGSLATTPDARREWVCAVQGKRSRMVPKYPDEKYATRFRLKGSPDPRLNQERQV